MSLASGQPKLCVKPAPVRSMTSLLSNVGISMTVNFVVVSGRIATGNRRDAPAKDKPASSVAEDGPEN